VPSRIVVLVSGGGSNLQALLDAAADPAYGATVVAVGADRFDIEGLVRAEKAGVPTFVVELAECADRAEFDARLADAIAEHQPDWVVSAGFMKLFRASVLGRFGGRIVNTHPSLLPAFPGATPVADTLAYGAKLTGVTVHLVDETVDGGPVLAQAAVPVLPGDDEESLHERIKEVERSVLVETVGRLARNGLAGEGREVRVQ
jgi:phosphoribosylglycinamide formyltransferase 1